MARFKKRINWKGIVAAVLTVAIILGVAAGITAFVKNDTQTISSLSFSRGALDSEGAYIETDKSIFTKDAFNCIGLRVEPDFKFKGTFDVFYYDFNGHFVHAVEGLSSIYDEDFPLAKMARVVVHPEVPEGEDEDDFKISFFEVQKYASQFKITVDKNQKYKYETFNLIESVEVIEGMSWEGPEVKVGADLKEHIEENVSGSKATEKIAVKYDNYDIFVRYGEMAQVYTVGVALTADDIITAEISHDCRDSAKGEWVKLTIEVPEDSDTEYLRVRLPSTAECYIFGYND